MKYLPIFILTIIFLGGCNDSYDIPKEYEKLDETIYRSDLTPLSKDIINEKIKDIQLDLSQGRHGEIYANDTVTFDMTGIMPDDVSPKRYLSYYIPHNLSNNYKIFFDFHGSFDSLPFKNVNGILRVNDDYIRYAEANNAIIVRPLGTINIDEYSWTLPHKNLYFFDIMLELFRQQLKDQKGFEQSKNGVYISGTSAGGMFTWALSYYRSKDVGVAVPRFGSAKPNGLFVSKKPEIKVPMMVITGTGDTHTAPYTGVLKNTRNWARYIYDIQGDSITNTIPDFDWGVRIKRGVSMPAYTQVQTTTYESNDAIIQAFVIEGATHSEMKSSVYDAMFEFCNNHTRN